MKHGLGLGLALLACGVVEAADPPARPAPAASTPSPTPAVAKPAKPLDLRIGDVRKYMMPRDFQAVLRAPDSDANTVVVEGQREVAPMRMVEDVPMGLASLWYSVKDPKNAWRILAPAVTFKDGPTVDKVPPPVFRWGP
jgi:hypothetical protein